MSAAQYFESVETVWTLWIVAFISVTIMTRHLFGQLRRINLRRLANEEEGGAYSLGIVLVIPFYVFMIAALVETTLILAVKIGTTYAAYSATRSAVVWLPTDVPEESKTGMIHMAAINAMAPYASGREEHQVATSGEQSELSEKYFQNYQETSNGLAGQDYVRRKWAYAAAATRIKIDEESDAFNTPTTVTVQYDMPINTPGLGRWLGKPSELGGFYVRTITSNATLEYEGHKLPVDMMDYSGRPSASDEPHEPAEDSSSDSRVSLASFTDAHPIALQRSHRDDVDADRFGRSILQRDDNGTTLVVENRASRNGRGRRGSLGLDYYQDYGYRSDGGKGAAGRPPFSGNDGEDPDETDDDDGDKDGDDDDDDRGGDDQGTDDSGDEENGTSDEPKTVCDFCSGLVPQPHRISPRKNVKLKEVKNENGFAVYIYEFDADEGRNGGHYNGKGHWKPGVQSENGVQSDPKVATIFIQSGSLPDVKDNELSHWRDDYADGKLDGKFPFTQLKSEIRSDEASMATLKEQIKKQKKAIEEASFWERPKLKNGLRVLEERLQRITKRRDSMKNALNAPKKTAAELEQLRKHARRNHATAYVDRYLKYEFCRAAGCQGDASDQPDDSDDRRPPESEDESDNEPEGGSTGDEELDELLKRYQKMVAGADAFGWDVAAENLRFWLGTRDNPSRPDDRHLDPRWLYGSSRVKAAHSKTKNDFLGKIEQVANTLADGESKTFSDYWDRRISEPLLTEYFYATGRSTLSSRGQITVSRDGDTIRVTGHVENQWWDRYDWHENLTAYVPFFGTISDADALKLETAGFGKNFGMYSFWNQSINGQYQRGDGATVDWGKKVIGRAPRGSIGNWPLSHDTHNDKNNKQLPGSNVPPK